MERFLNVYYKIKLMKKLYFLFLLVLSSSFCAYAQEEKTPDYTTIKFRSYLKEYKKEQPSLEGLAIDKEMVSDIVRLLGKSFYSIEDREEITEKIWLAFTNPKKFDFVHKDYAIRSLPHWSKPNFQGKIVLEPNPYLKDWTKADTSLDYFKIVIHRILTHEGLMGYGEDAKSTKKSARKLKYAKGFTFRPVYTKDWTNSYLQTLVPQAGEKNNILLVIDGNYQFMIVEATKKEELLKLFGRMKWQFIIP
jgi:hypothetical protein